MGTFESVIVLFVALFLFVFYVYLIKENIMLRKMQKNSIKSVYVKDNSFRFMKNAGDNPCETTDSFGLYEFSQNCSYLVKNENGLA